LFGVTLPTLGRFFTLQKKIVRIVAAAQPRSLSTEILPVPCQYILSLMNFIINNRKIFQQIHVYTLLIEGMITIFIDPIPTYLVFKKVHFMLSEFSTFYDIV
jgi:hypothetical protein